MPLRNLEQEARTPTDDVKVLRKYLEQFRQVPILSGQMVTGSVPAGSTFVRIRHSLGRAYVGGFIAGVSVPESLNVQSPAAAIAGATDITTQVAVVTLTPVAADTTVSVWIF